VTAFPEREHRSGRDYEGLTSQPPRFPVGPAQRIIDLKGGPDMVWPPQLGDRVRSNAQRVYQRSIARGWFTVAAADQIACSLGLHPALVWGDAWFEPYLESVA